MAKQVKHDQQSKNDNIMNVATSLALAGKARNPASSFGTPKELSYGELDNIYLGDGLGKRIIDIYANEMIREWFKIEGDPDGLLLKYLKTLQTKKHINHALKWSRLYGASIVVMLIDDGNELEEPVNINTIKTIDSLRTVDRTQLSIQLPSDWYNDPKQANYGQPEIYTISPPKYASTNKARTLASYKVHESRILRFDGEIAPDAIMNDNSGFGISVLKPIYNYLRNSAQTYEYSAEIIHDFVMSVFSMKNLSSILATPNGAANIKTRSEVMAYCKSVINGIILDADGESYEKVTTQLSGLSDLINQFGLALSAVSGIPYMILMGESPSGLNANADNSIRAWYDSISAEQEEILGIELHKLISYILAASDNPLKNKKIDDLKIDFNSLWQYDEPTQIDMRNKQALTDQAYVVNGIVMPEEIAKSRFGGDKYSFETQINVELRD